MCSYGVLSYVEDALASASRFVVTVRAWHTPHQSNACVFCAWLCLVLLNR